MGAKINPATSASEAEALKSLIDTSWTSSYAEFARHCDLPGGKSMLSQHMKGTRPISLDCAIAYAIGLHRPLSDISPRLASLIAKLPSTSEPSPLNLIQQNKSIYRIDQNDPEIVVEITRIARRLDDIGKGMLLHSARSISKEREESIKKHCDVIDMLNWRQCMLNEKKDAI